MPSTEQREEDGVPKAGQLEPIVSWLKQIDLLREAA